MIDDEIIIINGEKFYRILNGTSYDSAPIPKEFKPYFERLQQKNKELKKQYEKSLEDYCRLDAYNKNRQKRFIEYLEGTIWAGVLFKKVEEILAEYKKIIGESNEKTR